MRNGRVRTRLQLVGSASPRFRTRERRVLITGGAGFIGCNLADRLCMTGEGVRLFDNLSRIGVEQNVAWLREKHEDLVEVVVGDMRDASALAEAVQNVSAVFHFAAQVAVTSSLRSPIHDFEVNARGTLNLLEALRGLTDPPPLIFTSTNKVYGFLRDVKLQLRGDRYEPVESNKRAYGIDEEQSLDFYSPYGCSKGAADQYVLDHAQTFGLPAVVFRMSCIYGPHQFGTEDQGWVAHFLIQAMSGRPITIYGDGKQVRDILFIDDLVEAFLLARSRIKSIAGNAFNIGGGAVNATSLIELIDLIGVLEGEQSRLTFSSWRPGDQRYYVSNFSKFEKAVGWRPSVMMRTGVAQLHDWLLRKRFETQAELATA